MQVGNQRALLAGLGVGIGIAAVGGAVAWMLGHDDGRSTHDHDTHDHDAHDHGPIPLLPPQGGGYVEAIDAPNTAGSAIPADADGPANLAVAWWPQDIRYAQEGSSAELRFQSTIVNLGGEDAAVADGDRVEYTLSRLDDDGRPGDVVARSSAPLDRGELQPFPVQHAGVETGHGLDELGVHLSDIDALAPQTAAIVGAGHPSQLLRIDDVRAGTYLLRQQLVRADGSTDSNRFDDARVTELQLDGTGGILHTTSRYDGDD